MWVSLQERGGCSKDILTGHAPANKLSSSFFEFQLPEEACAPGENFSRLTWLNIQGPVAYCKVGDPRGLSIGLARFCAITSETSFSEGKGKVGGSFAFGVGRRSREPGEKEKSALAWFIA